jgi:hypothetical protein
MRLAAACLALLSAAFAAHAQESTQPRAVVELFTSQGCSACPKADALIGKLAQDNSIVVLTLPVDYWDYLGWKDTLGSAANTARQRAYAMANGNNKVFTPQIVVSGIVPASGKDETAVRAAIEESRSHAEAMSLDVSIVADGDRFDVHAHPKSGEMMTGEVWLLATAKERRVAIGEGENAGKTLAYTNVVRKMTRLGPWNGRFCRFAIPREDALGKDGDTIVVLVQEGSGGMPGAILGAAQLAAVQ